MLKFTLRRIVFGLFILILVSMVIYTIMRCLPTSFIEAKAREMSSLPGADSYAECLNRLGEVYGISEDPVSGYFTWLGRALRGDFGDSWLYNMPVTEKFGEVIGDSFILGFASLALELVIAIPLGIYTAVKKDSLSDRMINAGSLVGISLPSFFFASLLKLIFAVKLGILPLSGRIGRLHHTLSPAAQLLDSAAHFVLPVLTLAITNIGFTLRYTRANMLEVLKADYIRTARAKGMGEGRVIFGHAFRNTLIPLVTLVGSSLPGLFSGAMITEQIFSIPGIGYTAYNAIINGDIPFGMFYLLFMAVLTLTGTLIADVLYAVVDPRVRVA